jgi:hypothetical protein
MPASHHAPEIIRRVATKSMTVAVGGKLLDELRNTKIRDLLVEWERGGRLVKVAAHLVDQEEQALGHCQSNDRHVIALARAGHVRLIYTDDQNLIDDIKNPALVAPKGKVVRTSTAAKTARSLFTLYGN